MQQIFYNIYSVTFNISIMKYEGGIIRRGLNRESILIEYTVYTWNILLCKLYYIVTRKQNRKNHMKLFYCLTGHLLDALCKEFR